jgi:hypothetical protein
VAPWFPPELNPEFAASSSVLVAAIGETASRGQPQGRARVLQVGVGLDAGNLRREGLAVGLEHIELQRGSRAVLVLARVSPMRWSAQAGSACVVREERLDPACDGLSFFRRRFVEKLAMCLEHLRQDTKFSARGVTPMHQQGQRLIGGENPLALGRIARGKPQAERSAPWGKLTCVFAAWAAHAETTTQAARIIRKPRVRGGIAAGRVTRVWARRHSSGPRL